MRRVIHAITPGDHYSPRTGSAIPTVVHGLAGAAGRDAAPERYAQFVAIESGTYEPRYESATPIEFAHEQPPTARQRAVDAGLARVGARRRAAERYFGRQAAALRDEAPSIVLAHNAPVLPRLLQGTQHRVVLYAHNDILRSMTRAEAARTLRDVTGIVAVSDSLAEQLSEHLTPELQKRLHVVVNGVDTAQFAPAPPRPERAAVRVMFIGRMIADKGPDLLLEAAAIAGRTDLELVMVGSFGFDPNATLSPYEERLRTLAAGVPGTVDFVPFEPRFALPGLLQTADVLVVPSRWRDPCPLAVGEGMASGLAIVAAEIGGIPEILGSAGLLFRSGDAADLARALGRLADDTELRTRLAAEARRRAVERDWDWAWSELRRVLERL
ncbi:glycosyltransferase family 4 protein [Gryllotalpicola reticulitermitis]|uniref:Glycosyltransferase family 4 protein n=1 Tax=Gryllotalpicola reticulitermitis TaxID=1184153 RepID=A0ABV8Q8N2_9MICO